MSRNRLAEETSPYLLQHKDNPVQWWPWGQEALEEAKRSGKPILLSVGYAACHWCHVMAHESFEDDETAAVMNDLFVNIKVDREERPDVDAIYMNALHSLGEQGGWPMTMFLKPDGSPFWGGTYFPKTAQYGRPGFTQVLQEISRIFHEEPEKIEGNASAITAHLEPRPGAAAQGQITDALLADAVTKLAGVVDPENGGVKAPMKFPQPSLFAFLWRAGLRYGDDAALEAVTNTLRHICQGGIYDHLGGGFARYTVDPIWLVPHFEKMLYDNAQLVDLLTEVWRETRNDLFRMRVEETVDWLLREMTVEGGGFASSLDADSEGEEGKFYVWTAEEIEEILGKEDAAHFASVYGVTPAGNWEGKTILNRLGALELKSPEEEARLAELRAKLFEARKARVRPGFDDKVLADWNGLMIAALAKAGFVFQREDWIAAAEAAYRFVRTRMTSDGRLLHSWREGEARAPATAGDYAAMIQAALALHMATGEAERITEAADWARVLDEFYWSGELGGYTLAASDTEDLIVRPFSGHDDAVPNPNGMMASSLMALWLLTGEDHYRERAQRIITGFTGEIAQNLFAHTTLLSATLDLIAPTSVVIAAPGGRGEAAPLLQALREVSLPGAVVQVVTDTDSLADASPAKGKSAQGGQPTAYVCVGPVCAPPASDAADFVNTLKERRRDQGAARVA